MLKYSKDLVVELKNIKCSPELRKEINIYIFKQKENKGFSNLIFRGNLHYILDNIKKETILDEIRSLNEK